MGGIVSKKAYQLAVLYQRKGRGIKTRAKDKNTNNGVQRERSQILIALTDEAQFLRL